MKRKEKQCKEMKSNEKKCPRIKNVFAKINIKHILVVLSYLSGIK